MEAKDTGVIMVCGFICMIQKEKNELWSGVRLFTQQRKPKKIVFFPRICYFNFPEIRGQIFLGPGSCRNYLTRLKDRHILRFFQVSGCEKDQEKLSLKRLSGGGPRNIVRRRSACLTHFLAREKTGAEKKWAEDKDEEGGESMPGVVGEL